MDNLYVHSAVSTILECARSGLEATSNQAPKRVYVSMGEPAHDDCCDGQLVAWWSRQYPSAAFPDADVRNALCGWAQTAVEVNVEIVRCSPGVNPNTGEAPSVEVLAEVARVNYVDARAVWTSVLCCLTEHIRPPSRWSAIVAGQVPVGPSGGCVGSRMTVVIGLADGCACD